MHSRTSWFKWIPLLLVMLALIVLAGPVLAGNSNQASGSLKSQVAKSTPVGEQVLVPESQPVEQEMAAQPAEQPNKQPNKQSVQIKKEKKVKVVSDGVKGFVEKVELGLPVAIAGSETVSLTAEETKLINLINGARKAAGTAELTADNMVTVMARLKAEDMASRGQLAYQSPTYGTMEDMLRQGGVEYKDMKVNLARAYSPESAHNLFMRYSSAKSRILDPAFDQLGVACKSDGKGNYYVVEVFIDSPDSSADTPPADDNSESNTGNTTGDNQPGTPQTGNGITADEQQMLNLVNNERAKLGIKPLQMDPALLKLARMKAQDMIDNNYFGHTSPTYGSPFDMMRNAGITYSYAGENLAKASTVTTAHNALMNSSGHRANILNQNYDHVGIGIVKSGSYRYFVQMFTGGQRASSPAPAPQPSPEPVPAPQPSPQPTPQPAPTPAPSPAPGTGQNSGTNYLTSDELKMFQLVNKERAANGVGPLVVNQELVKLARMKAQDMINKNYFDHNSPTYGSPFDMMKTYGVKYTYAGENLAGAPTVDSAHTNLMNSEGHRRNILNSNYTEVGIGIVDGGPYGKMFVQMFIHP